MSCPSCGADSRPGAKFCHECGARLDLQCAVCGAAASAEQKFCSQCGARLAPAAAPGAPREPPPHSRYQGPASYTPAHLAERILKDRAALQGERKQVTVLFADVSRFAAISEALDPEEGHGLMALFGAPVAHEDHARRAALAALGIRSVVGRYAQELRAARGIEFHLRMGLNTGLVVVGAIGDNLRMDYTAVGDTTNVAARLQQLAQPDRILLWEPTRHLIEPYFELAARGPVRLRNRAAPVQAWELRRARPHAAPPRALAPLLGRAEALAALERAAAAVQRTRRGQVVYVAGEAGMGTSRLRLELRRRLGDRLARFEGHCLSFGQSTVFLPFVEVLRQLFGIAEADSEAEIIAKVARELEALGERVRGLAPYIRFALAVDPGDPSVAAMEPAERCSRLLRGVPQLFQLKSLGRPVVLAIEAPHWIDSVSEDSLELIIDEASSVAGLFILTWRPTYRPPFNEHTYVSRIVLEPLDERNSLELVRATLTIHDLPDELARVIARKAAGNPFFLEEIGRAPLDTGAVRAEAGRLVLARPAASIVVPDRVQDVIAARIDRLRPEQKRTVQTAAVIGREFALRLLRRVADAADRVEGALGELKALEFVYEKAALDDFEYVFKHALTQDVAYESILQARRRELHARIGTAIEELYADRVDERAEELAHHFLRGKPGTRRPATRARPGTGPPPSSLTPAPWNSTSGRWMRWPGCPRARTPRAWASTSGSPSAGRCGAPASWHGSLSSSARPRRWPRATASPSGGMPCTPSWLSLTGPRESRSRPWPMASAVSRQASAAGAWGSR
jgi:class 3 adenylate cyclase